MNTHTPPACFDVRKVLTANAFKQRKPRTPRAAYKPAKPMFKHELTAGIGSNFKGKALDWTLVIGAIANIRIHLASNYAGYSEHAVRGGYLHTNGEFVNEESRTWAIVTDKPIEPACEFIRAALNQESVLLVSTQVNAKFVKAHV